MNTLHTRIGLPDFHIKTFSIQIAHRVLNDCSEGVDEEKKGFARHINVCNIANR
jgi:hypothetical protein